VSYKLIKFSTVYDILTYLYERPLHQLEVLIWNQYLLATYCETSLSSAALQKLKLPIRRKGVHYTADL